MRYIITTLIILTVAAKVAFYALLQGKHDAMFFVELQGCREAMQYFIIGSFIGVIIYKSKHTVLKAMGIFGISFCAIAMLIPLYCFLPISVVLHIKSITDVFYSISGICLLIAIIFYLFCIRLKIA